jgi:large subunit ribosomal protein L30
MRSQSPKPVVWNWQKYLTDSKMAKIRITQTRSILKRPKDQRLTIQALGLGKIHNSVEVEATPQIMGMVNKVSHLVSVSE